MLFVSRKKLQHAAVSHFSFLQLSSFFGHSLLVAIVFKAIDDFKQAKTDLMQFNMNKSEISDDSRLFKIQGDLNLIDHEINSVRA